MKKDFDKLIPSTIKEIEEVLNSLVISKTEEIILYTSEKGCNEFNELLKESYYKLLNDT